METTASELDWEDEHTAIYEQSSQVRRRLDPIALSRETRRASRDEILVGERPALVDPHQLFQQIAAKVIAEGARRDAERAERAVVATVSDPIPAEPIVTLRPARAWASRLMGLVVATGALAAATALAAALL